MGLALQIVQRYHPEVTEVVDAKKGITVRVSSADCKAGSPKDPSACAMAHALCRTYDGALISLWSAYLIKGKRATRYRVPPYVARELIVFDRNKRFEPGTYSLMPIQPSQRLGVDRSQPNKHNYPKRRAPAHITTGVRSL